MKKKKPFRRLWAALTWKHWLICPVCLHRFAVRSRQLQRVVIKGKHYRYACQECQKST